MGVLCCAWKAFYGYHGLEGIKEMTFLNTVRCQLCVCARVGCAVRARARMLGLHARGVPVLRRSHAAIRTGLQMQ